MVQNITNIIQNKTNLVKNVTNNITKYYEILQYITNDNNI